MPEIKHQQLNGSPEISSAEIHIGDDGDLGTGSFTTTFSPSALPAKEAISSIMLNAPSFQISATVNPNGDLPVLIGTVELDTAPRDSATFKLPPNVERDSPHVLKITFAEWKVSAAELDGIALMRKLT